MTPRTVGGNSHNKVLTEPLKKTAVTSNTDAEDNLARPRTELHMARHTAAPWHIGTLPTLALSRFMKPVK